MIALIKIKKELVGTTDLFLRKGGTIAVKTGDSCFKDVGLWAELSDKDEDWSGYEKDAEKIEVQET